MYVLLSGVEEIGAIWPFCEGVPSGGVSYAHMSGIGCQRVSTKKSKSDHSGLICPSV